MLNRAIHRTWKEMFGIVTSGGSGDLQSPGALHCTNETTFRRTTLATNQNQPKRGLAPNVMPLHVGCAQWLGDAPCSKQTV